MDNKEAVSSLKEYFASATKAVAFIEEMCYINRGMWDGDINELIAREAKRDIALTLRNFIELREEELIAEFQNNGDMEWLKQTILKLQRQ